MRERLPYDLKEIEARYPDLPKGQQMHAGYIFPSAAVQLAVREIKGDQDLGYKVISEYSWAKSREMGARLRKTAKIPGFKRLFVKMWGPVRFLCEGTEKREVNEMGLFKDYVSQTRKPEGFLGKMMLSGMNSGHAKMADWGLNHLQNIAPESIADLGCGGGRNAGELLRRYLKAHVTAVDYSELSVEKAKEYNQKMIAAGRCTVQQGDVSSLELPEESYDLATAFETIYFWPGLSQCFSQVAKVLKPGGYFMICNESDGTDATSLKFEKIIDGMKNYTAEDITAALKEAGFSKVKTDHHKSKPWLTVLARK